MISKQEFLKEIRDEVFPTLLKTENKRKKKLFIGAVLIALALLILLFSGLLSKPNINITKDFFDLISIFWCFGIAAWIFYGKSPALIVFLFGATIFCIFHESHNASFPLVISLLLGFEGFEIWKDFTILQKEKYTPIFLKMIGNLEKDGEAKQIDASILRHTLLFPKFNHIVYGDCFIGSFKNTNFSIAELKLLSNHTTRRSGRREFTGVCIDIPLKNKTTGYTLLINTKIPRSYPILQKLKLEDIVMNNNYQIFSDNQIEARKLLTPKFMEKLNTLKQHFKNKRIDVSFFDNHIFITIYTFQNLFESYSIYRNATNIITYEKFYDDIKSVYDLIEILQISNKELSPKNCFKNILYTKISSAIEKRKYHKFYIFFGIWGIIMLFLLLKMIFFIIFV